MLFAGGACSQGPGMVVNDDLKVHRFFHLEECCLIENIFSCPFGHIMTLKKIMPST